MPITNPQIGLCVSYQDVANPPRVGYVVDVLSTATATDYLVIFEDNTETWSDLRQHGWSASTPVPQPHAVVVRDFDGQVVQVFGPYASDVEAEAAARRGEKALLDEYNLTVDGEPVPADEQVGRDQFDLAPFGVMCDEDGNPFYQVVPMEVF